MNNNSEATVSSGLQIQVNESRARDGPPDIGTSGLDRAETSLPSRYLLSNSMQRSDANMGYSDEENIYEDPDIFSRTV